MPTEDPIAVAVDVMPMPQVTTYSYEWSRGCRSLKVRRVRSGLRARWIYVIREEGTHGVTEWERQGRIVSDQHLSTLWDWLNEGER